jgi:trimeric autotransporter adhesin
VTLDGESKGTIDFSNATTLRQQKVWSTGTVSSGQHQVEIAWAGQKGVAGGTRINVDAVDVTGTLSSALTTVEQTDSHLIYTGAWTTLTGSVYSGGSTAYVNAVGGSVTVHFPASYLVWLAKTASVYGIAKVTVDDKAPVMVDLYSSATLYKQPVWNTGSLTEGAHAIKIEWTGTKNSKSTKTNIGIDAIQVLGAVD